MSNKTFKSSVSNRTIDVTAASTRSVGLILSDDSSLDITIAKTDAPALALAILEAAGWPEADPTSATRTIMQNLRCVVEFDERKAKEAADREALEREALALCNAFQDAGGYEKSDVMTTHHYDYGKWMDAARKAREIHGSTK